MSAFKNLELALSTQAVLKTQIPFDFRGALTPPDAKKIEYSAF
jgi:hypothetical protein